MEEIHRARYVGWDIEPLCSVGEPLSPDLHVFTSLEAKLSEPHPFGFLWRFHYIGMID